MNASLEVQIIRDRYRGRRQRLALESSPYLGSIEGIFSDGRTKMEDTGASPVDVLCSSDEYRLIMAEVLPQIVLEDDGLIVSVWLCGLRVQASKLVRPGVFRLRGADGRTIDLSLDAHYQVNEAAQGLAQKGEEDAERTLPEGGERQNHSNAFLMRIVQAASQLRWVKN